MKNLILTFTLLVLVIPCKAEIIIVDPNGSADFDNIQDAINYSSNGDSVIVRRGTYNENISFNGRAITLTSTDPNDPNVVESTIITADSGYSITFDFAESSDSILAGFTITTKGIRCYDCAPTIKRNIITQCGKGIYGESNARPTIHQNIITYNWGGIWGCSGVISQNVITHNSEQPTGGGLSECHGQIFNNLVAWNRALDSTHHPNAYGGGFYRCNGTISNNTIVNNYSADYGGAIANCDANIFNNIIAYNEAAYPSGGGGIYGACNNRYNCFYINEGGHFANGASVGVGDFASDPLFANHDSNDYHLKSGAGRWNPISETWVIDDANSPCIDAGDPCDPTYHEPYPNGDAINQGAYGGTEQASKSPYGQTVYCDPNILGDVSCDCKVDFKDFSIMARDWLRSENPDPNLWVVRYNGLGNDDDYGFAIAIDDFNNIYVTGKSYGSGTSYDYATIKYDPNGNQLWVARYDGPGSDYDCAKSIALDKSGNIYVTGYSSGDGTSYDYATIKYDPNGNQLWVQRYNGPVNDDDKAEAIVIDEFGNIYVTGDSYGNGTSKDYATIKYDPNGNQLWLRRYDGPANNYEYVDAIAIDSSGNIYVTGRSMGSATNYDYATVKYAPNGNELWVARYNGPGNNYDTAYAIEVDSKDNVYVTGGSKGSGTDSDYATIKYDPNGDQLWVRRYNGPGNSYDYAEAIAIDKFGNIYVTGYSCGDGTAEDYATIKYDPNGNQLWLRRYNGPGDGRDLANNIATDKANNVYVAGYSVGAGTSWDYVTIKYDPNGNQLWVARYNGPGDGSYDIILAIAIDDSGNVCVTGHSEGSGTGDDYATVKYAAILEIVGDVNGDYKVNFEDFALFTQDWLECNLDPPEACWE